MAALGFVSAKGRPVASPPAALRKAHPDEVKALRAELKELRHAVAAERVRLEGILAEGRVWDAESWIRHYLDDPVTGVLARRLLWEVSEDEGRTWVCGLSEALMPAKDRAIEDASIIAQIRRGMDAQGSRSGPEVGLLGTHDLRRMHRGWLLHRPPRHGRARRSLRRALIRAFSSMEAWAGKRPDQSNHEWS